MKLLALAATLLLSACQIGPTWHDVRKDEAVFDIVQRQAFSDRKIMAIACLDTRGHFTSDGRACMVQKRGICVFLTATADAKHDPELTALCNGYRA